jgi:hypothetical protein
LRISVGWQVMLRREGARPTNSSTMVRRCKESLCSSGLSLNWQLPMRDNKDPRSLSKTLNARKGSVQL